jgi:hypothetical protein
MSIDGQRYTAVRVLEALGLRWDGAKEWLAPSEFNDGHPAAVVAAADATHGELTGQIEDLAGCPQGSAEAEEMDRLLALARAYEKVRPVKCG